MKTSFTGKHLAVLVALLAANLFLCAGLNAETLLDASSLVLKSNGTGDGRVWTLSGTGYVGTCFRLDKAGEVTIEFRGKFVGSARPSVRGNIVVADTKVPFALDTDGLKTVRTTFRLPEGSYVVRIEFPGNVGAVALHSLKVTGAVVLNEKSDATALAVADTYIRYFRQGRAKIQLSGVLPGAQVRIRQTRQAFHFGTAFGGSDVNSANRLLNDTRFTEFLLGRAGAGVVDGDGTRTGVFRFDTITPENAAKWAPQENKRGEVNLAATNLLLEFARKNDLRVRGHTIVWEMSIPDFAEKLLKQSLSGDAAAKAELRGEIRRRIQYFANADFVDIDVINEAAHQGNFWKLYGAKGIAEMYNETAGAVEKMGGHARLFANEYNIFQWSTAPGSPPNTPRDDYANWYREHVEMIRDAGGKISGIGVQYYVQNSADAKKYCPHSPARIMQVFQNLAIPGLPIVLSEFGVNSSATKEDAALFLDETMRMVFGTAGVDTFLVWGFWEGSMWKDANKGAFLDENFHLTPAGKTYERLLQEWSTHVELRVDAAGAVEFTGFYGDYEISVGGKSVSFRLVKGTEQYAVRIGE